MVTNGDNSTSRFNSVRARCVQQITVRFLAFWFWNTGLPRSGDNLPRGVTHGLFTNTTQQGVSLGSHLATHIAHVLTNVEFTDVHLQKF